MGLFTCLCCTLLLDFPYRCYQPATTQRILLTAVYQLGLTPGRGRGLLHPFPSVAHNIIDIIIPAVLWPWSRLNL
jgi:hypothetical protein